MTTSAARFDTLLRLADLIVAGDKVLAGDKALRCSWCGGELRMNYPQGETDDTVASIECGGCEAEWSSEGTPWRDRLGIWLR